MMPQTEHPYTRLGEQIDRLVRALALAKNWRMGRAMAEVAQRTGYAEATVYRWRQGRLCPPGETVEILARVGREEANLDRVWGESVLKAARYPEATHLVSGIWGPKEVRAVPNNLPSPAHTAFVGRQAEMARLLELLSPDHAAHLISVDGIGGVGKTTLVLEAAYRCLRASTGETPDPRLPTFEAIIFTSAKQQYLTPHGILARHQAQRTLRDIFREIARTLDRPEITRVTLEQQPIRARDALARQHTMLIADNLETVEDKQDVLAFLYDLPPQVKVVITTRERVLFSPIRLGQLSKEDGLLLIRHEAWCKGVESSNEQMLALYQHTGGIPVAMVYAVGQIAAGHSVQAVLARVAEAAGDVARFCFEGSVAHLRGKPAHHLLMAVAMFLKRPLQDAVAYVAGLGADPIATDDGLAQLQHLSLINQREGRYSMLPLTREYALAELAAHPDFKREARERWVRWYRDYTHRYGMGGTEWEEWHIQYDRLEEEWENILAALDWCAKEDRHEDVGFIWDNAAGFANIYGHWDDSLVWADWLIQSAKRRGDWSAAIHYLAQKGSRLTFTGQIAEVEAILLAALDLREHASPKLEVELLRDLARLRIRQEYLQDAKGWLEQAKQTLLYADLEERERKREGIGLTYWQAVAHFKEQNYNRAERLFEQVREQGEATGWQRAVNYAQNWLADIAVVRGDVDEAESLLHTGLAMAERNRDRRRIAFYKRSFAHLAQKRRHVHKARRWAQEALDGFERLGMRPEAEEMQGLLRTIGSDQE